MVISIIGIIAAIALPVMHNFRPNYAASATRQLLDDLARARQLAISPRTTVYMVFVPTNFWNDNAYTIVPNWERPRGDRLLDKQYIGYNFVSLHSMGDQPGRPTIRYLSSWRTLPEGTFIHPAKFALPPQAGMPVLTIPPAIATPPFSNVYAFKRTNKIPFPSEGVTNIFRANQPFVTLPYLAFDYTGRLVSGDPRYPEVIPLARGSVSFPRDPTTKLALASGMPSFTELPAGNATNTYNLIVVDWLTGRAKAIQQEVK